MKLEEQVCSLEISKKLKELGIKQESLFYWHKYEDDNFYLKIGMFLDGNEDKGISAFTVAELGEMLPRKINLEANARAKMLIYLIENKLMEVK